MEKYLSDAAHYPGGHAAAVYVPRTVDEIPDIVRNARTLLTVGAQSSLTGGATPMGETLLSTERLTRIIEVGPARVTVEAGVTVMAIEETLVSRGAWFPPVPTFLGAFAGGIVATNAAGAATFRHGAVRRWVDAITVVLADGFALAIRRGDVVARDGRLPVPTSRGTIAVPVPRYRMPQSTRCRPGITRRHTWI